MGVHTNERVGIKIVQIKNCPSIYAKIGPRNNDTHQGSSLSMSQTQNTVPATTARNANTRAMEEDLVEGASLTNWPVEFDGAELPQSWTLRK